MSLKTLVTQNKPKLPDAKSIISKIEKELDKNSIDAEVLVGGSVAKNTYLKNFDFDIFVRFKKEVDSDLLEVILIKAFGKSKVDRLHGSRDYFQIRYGSQVYEIVPVLKISKASQAKNITDVSMLHVEWVNKNLKNPDEVRLAKLFSKAQGLYGAESYISGLSGYILEILIVRYGSFLKMTEAVSEWKSKTVIDVESHYKTKTEINNKLNKSKQISPLIVIDPVDKNRNAAAAVSEEKYAKFIYAAKEFLKRPTEQHFKKQKFSLSKVRQESKRFKAKLLVLNFKLLKGKEDVVSSKALKAYESINKKLENYDFTVLKSGIVLEENLMWFMVLPLKLPEFAKVDGPKVWVDKSNLEQFMKKHENVFLDGDKLASIRKRRFIDSKELVSFLIREDYVRERLLTIKLGK